MALFEVVIPEFEPLEGQNERIKIAVSPFNWKVFLSKELSRTCESSEAPEEFGDPAHH